MKVLHIISAPAAGGAEVYVKDLVGRFKESGLEVFIGFLNHAVDIGRDENYEDFFLSELDKQGVDYFFIGYAARKNPLLGMLRIRKYVDNNAIDIYHSHLKYGVLFGAFLKIPRVYTHHNMQFGAGQWWAHISNIFVDSYIGISNVCSKQLAKNIGRNVNTVMNGVDRGRLEGFASERTMPGTSVNIILVGGLLPQKNYKLIVDAVLELPRDLQDRCTVNIVGEGSLSETNELKDYIKLNNLGDVIFLLGNRNDVPSLLANAHLFVMSSAWEGLPISLIEAAISGLPCVVTDVGGCSEVVELCRNGIVTAPGDVIELAGAIATVFSDGTQYRKLSANAIANSSYFTIQAAADKHVDIYQSLLSGS
ncbi:MAG: glycosyltransferase family 4 protein [Gammaproteobacteria bacterium]|nr:glycosyltransferase family 4 protein [Gammaproteobacteria bacterium]